MKKFRGMFAFGLWDSRKKQLFLARDRIGIKPLYYYWDGKKLIFASEVKALLEAGIPREVNWEGIDSYLAFRFIPGEESVFKGVMRIPPGSYILVNKGIVQRGYWNLAVRQSDGSENVFGEKLFELVKESVRMRLISDVPLGVFLSGGIDSSSIVGMMSKVCPNQIETFSVEFNDPDFDETEFARAVSEMYGTEHHEFVVEAKVADLFPKIVWHFDEPIADPALFPTYILSENARKYVKVVLTGEGGDELFAGYEQYKILSFYYRYLRRLGALRKAIPRVAKMAPERVKNKVFAYSSALGEEALKRLSCLMVSGDRAEAYLSLISIFDKEEKDKLYNGPLKRRIRNGLKADVKKWLYKYDLLNSLLFYELKTSLVDHLLMKVDKMSMAHSLEARVPLLDHRVVELAFRMPVDLKLKGSKDKYIFRKTMKPLLPEKVFGRRKQRFFVPIDKWLKHELGSVASEILSEKSFCRRGYFNYSPIRRMFEKFNKSRLYYSRQFWSLLSLEIWFRLYVDDIKMDNIL